MKMEKLAEFGQSIWLDSISRTMIESGDLKKMIDSGLRGMTSNPTIFDKAISSGNAYDNRIKELHNQGKSTFEIYDELTVMDVQDAADLFRTVYDQTGGLDGYVSLEVNPKLAFDTDATVAEARRLHKKVNRPNVMFKVPATEEGFPAIETLLASGINVNITLIFSIDQYEKTARTYINGMKKLLEQNGDPGRMASVASVFVSRIDTAVDKLIDAADSPDVKALRGRAAVANSRLVYQKYLELFEGNGFDGLREKGVPVQRVLWGSTGTKDPGYSDIKYVTEIMGKPTVNTLPGNTLDAFIDHGTIADTLSDGADDSRDTFSVLDKNGIDIDQICAKLLDEGLKSFVKSFESLLETIESKNR